MKIIKKKCHTVGAVPKTLNEGKLIPLIHKYMAAHLPGLEHGDQGWLTLTPTNGWSWLLYRLTTLLAIYRAYISWKNGNIIYPLTD